MYTVYRLEERLSPTGMPYIGCSKRLEGRAKQHQKKLALTYTPILYPIQEFSNPIEAHAFEQDMRVKNGWGREYGNYISTIKAGEIGGKVSGKNSFENKTKIFGLSKECEFDRNSKAGKNAVITNRESGHINKILYINNVEKVICPFCNITGQSRAMKRWHFDKCKNKIK